MPSSLLRSSSSDSLLEALTIARPESVADYVAFITFLAVFCLYVSRGKAWDRPDPLHYMWFERPQLKDGIQKTTNKQTRNVAQRMEELVCNYLRRSSLTHNRCRTRSSLSSGDHNPERPRALRTGWPEIYTYALAWVPWPPTYQTTILTLSR